MTYIYRFVTVAVTLGTTQPKHPTYQDVIAEHAKQGWRFVQLVVDNPAAVPTAYVLIFERPVSAEPQRDG